MSGDETVWATKFMNRSAYIFSVRAEGITDRHSFNKAYDQGQPIDPAKMPTYLVVKHKPVPTTDIFAIQNGVMVVSERLAELMSGFDLGPAPTPDNPVPPRAELHPMPPMASTVRPRSPRSRSSRSATTRMAGCRRRVRSISTSKASTFTWLFVARTL